MNLRWYWRAMLGLASGAALAFSFPKFSAWPLAWIALTLLVVGCVGARPGAAFLCGFLQSLVFYPVSVPWMDTVMQQYGNVGAWTAAGILALVAIAAGVISGCVGLGIALVSRPSDARGVALGCAMAPFLWVAAEFARTDLPIIAFPWNLLGYAVSPNLALVQMTVITGIWGLSFLVAAWGALLAFAILSGRHRPRQWLLAATAALIIVAGAGGYLVPRPKPPRHVAHLVQTNFAQSESYPAGWLSLHAADMAQLEEISVSAARRQPGLIVWPEVPAPFSFNEPWDPAAAAAFAALARGIARDAGGDFLVGVVDWKQDARGNWLAANSAVLLDPAGARRFTYDKIHLVPFGEYVPLRRWLGFTGKLTADIGDFTPGRTYTVGALGRGRFSVYICYEAAFPDEVRRFAKHGAELLINVSNDGWFGRSAAPAQHLRMARVRAVENRRWLLRDTNNGFTVAVDPYGRIVARLSPDIRGELDAPYDFRSDTTLYARCGDWFPWLCAAASFALLAFALLPRGLQREG